MTNAEYRQHAIDCGLNMTCADACHVMEANGCTVAHAIYDPVHGDKLVHSGTTLTLRMCQWLSTFGVDYVTFRI